MVEKARINMIVTVEEKEAWARRAREDRVTLTTWVRQLLNGVVFSGKGVGDGEEVQSEVRVDPGDA